MQAAMNELDNTNETILDGGHTLNERTPRRIDDVIIERNSKSAALEMQATNKDHTTNETIIPEGCTSNEKCDDKASSSSSSSSSPLHSSADRVVFPRSICSPSIRDGVVTAPLSPTFPQVDPWKVELLKSIPEMYRLERTNIRVSDSAPRQVAQRIASFLRKESIDATYNSEEAIAKAKTADNNVRLKVRLFSDCGKVVAEVQRRAGCSYIFHQIAKAILLTANGESIGTWIRDPSKQFSIPASCRRLLHETDEDKQNCIIESLEMALSMLSPNNYFETHQLAMESLLSLSGTGDTANKAFVARHILHGKLRSVLTSLMQGNKLEPATIITNYNENEEHAFDEVDEQHYSLMRRHASIIMANCLDSIEQSKESLPTAKEDETTPSR